MAFAAGDKILGRYSKFVSNNDRAGIILTLNTYCTCARAKETQKH